MDSNVVFKNFQSQVPYYLFPMGLINILKNMGALCTSQVLADQIYLQI